MQMSFIIRLLNLCLNQVNLSSICCCFFCHTASLDAAEIFIIISSVIVSSALLACCVLLLQVVFSNSRPVLLVPWLVGDMIMRSIHVIILISGIMLAINTNIAHGVSTVFIMSCFIGKLRIQMISVLQVERQYLRVFFPNVRIGNLFVVDRLVLLSRA